VLPLFFCAQNTWLPDAEKGFKIPVPANYRLNQFRVYKRQRAFAHYTNERTPQITNEDSTYPQNPVAHFCSGVVENRLSSSSTGNTCGAPFNLKSYSRTHERKVEAYVSNTPKQSNGQDFSGNNRDDWIPGNYSVEIWHNGKIPGTGNYTFQ